MRLYNACARLGKFSTPWKKAEFVFFVKKGKNPKVASSYRPICLLPVLSKVLEKLMKTRIMLDLDSAGFLHDEQYGFRENRSTESAILVALDHVRNVMGREYPALVSLDIKGAFDFIDWGDINTVVSQAPIDKGLVPLISSYLTNRRVVFKDKNRWVNFRVKIGCPRGSCLGLLFWTLIADQTLKRISHLVTFIAFADDFLLLAAAKSRRELEGSVNGALEGFVKVSKDYGLQVSVDKTEAVLFGKGRKHANHNLR